MQVVAAVIALVAEANQVLLATSLGSYIAFCYSLFPSSKQLESKIKRV